MTTSIRFGLSLFALLSLGDIATLALTDGHHPPYAVAALVAVLGVASLYFVVAAWRGSRGALRPLLIMRILSALTAVPALFVSGVPTGAVGAAVAVIALTAICVLLIAPARSSAASR